MILKVYDEDFKNVKKEVEGEVEIIPFGIVRKLLALIDSASDEDDTEGAVRKLAGTSDMFMKTLKLTFPKIKEEEWDYVNLEDIIDVSIEIVTSLMGKFNIIPKSKNK